MILKDRLIKSFKKAFQENNILLKENIVVKWVHRFGIDSLNDLLIHSSAIKENNNEEKNQEQIKLKLLKTKENKEETKSKFNKLENFSNNKILNKNQNSDNNKKQYDSTQKLPLPYIKNLRKWINNNKKAS